MQPPIIVSSMYHPLDSCFAVVSPFIMNIVGNKVIKVFGIVIIKYKLYF